MAKSFKVSLPFAAITHPLKPYLNKVNKWLFHFASKFMQYYFYPSSIAIFIYNPASATRFFRILRSFVIAFITSLPGMVNVLAPDSDPPEE